MISLSTPIYDPNGWLLLAHVRPSNLYQAERRGSVTATLDGGVSVYDTGYAVADQTLTARWSSPTRAQLDQLQYLVAYYAELVVCVETGAFMARPAFAISKNTVSLSLRLLRRLDA